MITRNQLSMPKLPTLAVTALCSTCLIAPAWAQDGKNEDPAQTWIDNADQSSGGIAGTSLTQDFESGFNLGLGCGQSGWNCIAPGTFQIVSSGIAGFGGFSARATSSGTAATTTNILSPANPTAETGIMAADVVINDIATLFQFNAANLLSGAGSFNTRINFEANGVINVLQITTAPPCTTGVFVAATSTWTPGVKMRIGVEVLPGGGNGSLKVYKDGVLIFTGEDVAQHCNVGDPDVGITQFRTFTTNVGTTTTFTVDNFSSSLGTPVNPCLEPLPSCPGDVAPIGGNNVVNVDDLLVVINTWGQNGNPSGPRPQGDTRPLPNGNCLVNVDDLLGVINEWGGCPAATGACCLSDGTCVASQTEAQCDSASGTYQGDKSVCTPGLCPVLDNDDCEDAVPLTAPASVSDSLSDATQDTAPDCDGVATSAGRWYTIIGTGKTLTASTCSGPGQIWNGKISVYCANSCADLACVTGVDLNSCNFFQETATWCGVNGQKYWILVHTDSAPGDGNYTLTVTEGGTCTSTVVCPPPPLPNDECTGALTLTCGQTVSVTPAQYALYTANAADPVTSCEIASGGPFTHDAGWWYKITTGPAQTSLRITMCATDPTLDVVVGLFSGTCAALVEVDCDDDFCDFPNFSPSEFCAVVQPNTQYFIHVNHYAPAAPGTYTLTADCSTVCTAASCGTCTGVAEGVPCSIDGDVANNDPNGGCNVTPAVFGPTVSLNQTRCGVNSTFVPVETGNFRDLDWYLFTPSVTGSYTIQVCTGYPGLAGFITNGTTNVTTCGPTGTVLFVAGAATFPANAPVNITSTLTGGTTYAVVVGPSVFTGVPCPAPGTTNSRFTIVTP